MAEPPAFVPPTEARPRYSVFVTVEPARFHTLEEATQYVFDVLAVRPDADVTISNEYP